MASIEIILVFLLLTLKTFTSLNIHFINLLLLLLTFNMLFRGVFVTILSIYAGPLAKIVNYEGLFLQKSFDWILSTPLRLMTQLGKIAELSSGFLK